VVAGWLQAGIARCIVAMMTVDNMTAKKIDARTGSGQAVHLAGRRPGQVAQDAMAALGADGGECI